MDLTEDELAGVVDLFGGLTREELGRALAELAYKRGEEYDPNSFEGDIDGAVDSYRLIELEDVEGSPILVAGPAAFPALSADADDLVHILEIDRRKIDRERAGRVATERFRGEAARAVAADDGDRIATLLDVSYELEAWASVDLGEIRDRLDSAV